MTRRIVVCTVMVLASAAAAQVPFIQVQMSDGPYPYTTDCKPPATLDTLAVTAHNLNTWFVGADLSIQYPPALLFLGDLVHADSWNGTSTEGIAVGWLTPQNGFESVELFRVHVIWTGSCDCGETVQPVYVSGLTGNDSPRIMMWPQDVLLDVEGRHSVICAGAPPISVTTATWGRIKALYR